MSEPLFSLRRLLLYLLKTVGLLLIPLGIFIAVAVRDPSKRTLFALLAVLLLSAPAFNYLYCWMKHRNLLAKNGDHYRAKLQAELDRIGFDGLIGRFWVGLD